MRNRFLLILLSFFTVSAVAQQSSSKSKSKDKLYEKEGQRQIEVNNSVLINSPNLEFSPVYYQNGLVYVTSRYKSGAVDKKINETFFELFYSELDAAKNFQLISTLRRMKVPFPSLVMVSACTLLATTWPKA